MKSFRIDRDLEGIIIYLANPKKAVKGGHGSGNFGHAGRPGQVGGSQAGTIGDKIIKTFDLANSADLYEITAEWTPERAAKEKKIRQLAGAYLDAHPGIKEKDISDTITKAIESFGKKYPSDEDLYKSWKVQALLSTGRILRHELGSRTIKAVSRGDITPEEGHEISYDVERGDWKPLPDVLFHATVDSAGVIKNGIQSRYDRDIYGGAGLGGGNDQMISFTGKKEYAREIERGLHEMHMVANGQMTVRKMVELAKAGAGGVGHDWSDKLFDFAKGIVGGRSLEEIIDMSEGKAVHHRFLTPDEPYTQEDIEGVIRGFFSSYQAARSDSGGFENVMFMFNDREAIRKLNPKNFKVLVYKPKTSKAQGEYFWAEDEYRVGGGGFGRISEIL